MIMVSSYPAHAKIDRAFGKTGGSDLKILATKRFTQILLRSSKLELQTEMFGALSFITT